MPVEAIFPEPLVFEPASGVHKHTIILLHGRGGSADTFGPALLNTSILTIPPAPEYPVRGGQAVEDGNDQPATIPNPTPDNLVVKTSTYVTLPPGADPDPAPSTGTPRSPALVHVSPNTNASHHHHTTPKQSRVPTTLAQALPHAKFVFPNAPRQRATVYKRSIIRQWFDDWHLRPELSGDHVGHRYDEGLQTSGLGDTVRYLQGLVANEADLVVGGVRNVVLGGISQGCAASLVTALLWEGDDRLGAVVGMCGWLPYLAQMKQAIEVQGDDAGGTGEEGDLFEPFERPASLPASSPAVAGSLGVAGSWLRAELELEQPAMQRSEMPSADCGKIPIGLYHGRDDRKVDCDQGQTAADFLPSLGMEVRNWESYDGVGHEYSGEMLADILEFLKSVLHGASSCHDCQITSD